MIEVCCLDRIEWIMAELNVRQVDYARIFKHIVRNVNKRPVKFSNCKTHMKIYVYWKEFAGHINVVYKYSSNVMFNVSFHNKFDLTATFSSCVFEYCNTWISTVYK
uniref:Uncharacterized protein n=1 Tax=Glossina austeni TaxID=7395 RepID=A0A1A9UUJ1_GLOAU